MGIVEYAIITAIYIGMNAVILWFLTFILHFFISLNAVPHRRATWTVAPAYIATVIVMILWGPADFGIFAPVAALPGALIAYWFWLRDFRRAWVDHPEQLPAGVGLANHDWRVGILIVIALFAASAARRLL